MRLTSSFFTAYSFSGNPYNFINIYVCVCLLGGVSVCVCGLAAGPAKIDRLLYFSDENDYYYRFTVTHT